MNLGDLLFFLGASLALTVAPGPDNLFVLTVGATRGRGPALATAWGMAAGNLVHTGLVAGGVAALLKASPLAFETLRWLGVGYLLWMAWGAFSAALRGPSGGTERSGGPRAEDGAFRWFRRGLLMNLLNPKVIVFFLAFLPQFVPAGVPAPALYTVGLGLLFIAQVGVVFSSIALLAGSLSRWWRSRPGAPRVAAGLTGGVLVALSLSLLWGA